MPVRAGHSRRQGRIIRSNAEYESCLRRAAELRKAGATADTDLELSEIEAAIARYALIPGKPARRKGRPPKE